MAATAALIVIGCLATRTMASEYYGNLLVPRGHYLDASVNRSLVDVNTTLADGYLTSFEVYVHPLPDDVTPANLYLQLWTATPAPQRLVLKWQMHVTFMGEYDRVYEFPVPAGEHVYINKASDRLGMTTVSGINPVTYDFVPDCAVLTRHLDAAGLPLRGQTYAFSPLSYPARFSMGAHITDEMPTGSDDDLMYIGNDLHLRDGADSADITRVWIDDVAEPAGGVLMTYHLYAGEFSTYLPVVQLQIWTAVPGDSYRKKYTLKWEKRVQLTEGGNRAYTFNMAEEERVYVTHTDRIGFTFEHVDGISLSPIPSSFSGSHQSFMLEVSEGGVLRLGTTYEFDGLPMPKEFSVGITIDTGVEPSAPSPDSTSPVRQESGIETETEADTESSNNPEPDAVIDRVVDAEADMDIFNPPNNRADSTLHIDPVDWGFDNSVACLGPNKWYLFWSAAAFLHFYRRIYV